MHVDFSIAGASEMDKILKEMPFVVRKKVIAAAVRSGAAIIRKEAKRLAPYDENRKRGEHLRDHIVVRKKRRTNDIYQVGPDRAVPHAHLVEFGTGPRVFKEPHRVKLGGKWVEVTQAGVMPAKPFLRPAVDNKGHEAIAKIGERMGLLIDKAAEKLAGKYRTSGLAANKRGYRRGYGGRR